MAEPHDLLKARRESAALLGLGDVERLSPADTLRCDLISTLRLAIDGEQATVLDGGAADLAKLITATENLIRLLPGHELPEPKPADGGPSDPRTIMWQNYQAMRARGAAFGEGFDGLRLTVERLKAELAAKDAELERLKAGVPAPGEPGAATGNNLPVGDNVVPLRTDERSSLSPRPPAAPAAVDLRATRSNGAGGSAGFRVGAASDEPWRRF